MGPALLMAIKYLWVIGFQRLPFRFPVRGSSSPWKDAYFSKHITNCIGTRSKIVCQRGEKKKRGNSMCDELFFFVTSFAIELRQKLWWGERERDTVWITRTPTLYMLSSCIHVKAAEWLYGWEPYTLDCWLGDLMRWQIIWNWPLLGLDGVCYMWLSGYKCITTPFHHGVTFILVFAVCCKLPIRHSSFHSKNQESRVLWES